MSTDTPRPERMTLSDEEREALRVAINPAVKWGDCGRTVVARMHDDEGVDFVMETLAPAVEGILAAREQALREKFAAAERVILTAEEREALAFAAYAEHEPAFAHQENHTRLWETLMQQFREVVEAQRPEFERILAAREQAPREEIARLSRWKEEALPVLDGLQELGRALGLPLGERVTGPAALAAVEELQAALDRVRRLHQQETGNLAAGDWCPGCGDREPCATKRAVRGGAR